MKRLFIILLAAMLLSPMNSAAAWDAQTVVTQDQLPAETLYALDGRTYVTCVADSPRLFLLTEDSAGNRYITVFHQQPSGEYHPEGASGALPAVEGVKPMVVSTDGSMIIAYGGTLLYTFRFSDYKGWLLSTVQEERSYRCMPHLLINESTNPTILFAGNTAAVELYLFHPDKFPPNFALAAQNISWSGYSLVDNPDPADCLHLRAEPDEQADSLGTYYSGTPVLMTEDLGDWAKVVVANVEGYMLKSRLAFNVHMLVVEPAFPHRNIRQECFGQDLPVYSQPDTASRPTGILTDFGSGYETILILGHAGDDWYHVILGNGLTGYMQAALFTESNG